MTQFTPGRENSHRRPKGYAEWRPQAKTRALIDQVLDVLDEYAEQLPLTVRQVFYRLVGAHGYPKDELAYKRLCEHLVRARRAELIPFDSLRDDGVVVIRDRWFASIADFWDHVGNQARDYTRDKQDGQRVYVELWCEAAGMMPQLARVADEYSVPVFSCGGFSSLTAVRNIVDRVRSRDVPTVLLHVGDLDPSGESIFDAMTEDAAAFLMAEMLPGLRYLIPERVALTREQVAEFDLPTAPPKASDTRSAAWKGETCQAEALPPDELAQIVQDAIWAWMDDDVLDRHQAAEQSERGQLLHALPSGDETDGGRA